MEKETSKEVKHDEEKWVFIWEGENRRRFLLIENICHPVDLFVYAQQNPLAIFLFGKAIYAYETGCGIEDCVVLPIPALRNEKQDIEGKIYNFRNVKQMKQNGFQLCKDPGCKKRFGEIKPKRAVK